MRRSLAHGLVLRICHIGAGRPSIKNERRAAGRDPLGTPARRAALRLLDAVLRRGESLEAALPQAARAIVGPDRGLAHAMAGETLRWLPDLDALIDSTTRQRLPNDAKARFVLRIALVQTLRLGTPPHAAIATTLPLVDGGPRKLVHGVFGTLMRQGARLPETPTLPEDIVARWSEAWGDAIVAAAASAIAAPPPLDLTLADPSATDLWAERLGGVSLMPGHVRVGEHDAVGDMPGYAEGAWWVQDLAASLPARLLDVRGAVVDVCAAPGGKALQLAARGDDVIALDISKSRLARLRENFTRTRLKADVVTADALAWAPPAPVDGVLLDAPCSATGIFRRHPDVLYRAHPRVIAEMAAMQQRLLMRVADWVRPGGQLVYATCSLERDEGEAQFKSFLASRGDYRIDPILPEELPVGIVPDPGGWLRVLPGTLAEAGGCDGFFITRLVRASA